MAIPRLTRLAAANFRSLADVKVPLGAMTVLVGPNGLGKTNVLNVLHSFGSDRVPGASSAQMLIGVGRPGVSRGVLDDVRDALAGSLWYMRHEGGRYRFTTEPNLNKIIVEQEGAVSDGRILQLLCEATTAAAPTLAPFRVETNIAESMDIADEPRLTLGVLNTELTADGDGPGAAEAILNYRGSSARANKNAVVVVAAGSPSISRARQTARTVAAMQDITGNQPQLKRFNQEQKRQLADRLAEAESRLPQQVVMAYRHLISLGPNGNNGTRPSLVDLGPARGTDTITLRVIEHLAATDRLLRRTLAPAALLSTRFGVVGPDNEAVELDHLLGYFYRLPRLPKLANADVLRNCLARGVADGIFGLASGAAWYAPDAVRRFATTVDPSEIQFQPGTWLVRAAAIKQLIDSELPPESWRVGLGCVGWFVVYWAGHVVGGVEPFSVVPGVDPDGDVSAGLVAGAPAAP